MNPAEDDEEELTEEAVEAIYAESQYKIENVPGYADAFQRAYKSMTKIVLSNDEPTQQDRDEFDRAMLDLYLIDATAERTDK
jgi:hypothetical protein